MTATVRITDDGASVDGRLVEVPAGLDPVRYCLDRVGRGDGPVRALIVDERDGWEYRVVVHPDGRVEEDPDPPPAVRGAAVRGGARRWRLGRGAAVVAILVVAGGLAVDAARTEPPSSSPGSTVLQGAAPLTAPLATTTAATATTSSPAPAPTPTTTTRAAPTTPAAPTSASRRTTRPRPAATASRPPGTTRPSATPTTQPAPPPVVGGAAVARTVVDQLRADGAQVNRATCPALPAQLGATRRCTLVSDFGVFGVTVSVSRVRGTDVEFDIAVDQRARGD